MGRGADWEGLGERTLWPCPPGPLSGVESWGLVQVQDVSLGSQVWVTTGTSLRCRGPQHPGPGTWRGGFSGSVCLAPRPGAWSVCRSRRQVQAQSCGGGPHLQRRLPTVRRRCCCWGPPRWPASPWISSSCFSTPSGCAAGGARARSTWTPTAAAPLGASSSPPWFAGERGGGAWAGPRWRGRGLVLRAASCRSAGIAVGFYGNGETSDGIHRATYSLRHANRTVAGVQDRVSAARRRGASCPPPCLCACSWGGGGRGAFLRLAPRRYGIRPPP